MLIFESWAISQSLTTAFKGSTKLAKEFLKADSVEHLLMVLWADFREPDRNRHPHGTGRRGRGPDGGERG
jgi:hypothetical protein